MKIESRRAPARQYLQSAVRRGVVSGTAANLLSTVALLACSKLEDGHAAGGINGPSQWLWGEGEGHTKCVTWRHTAVGYSIHHASSILWATLHQLAFGPAQGKRSPRICAEAAATTATAYVVDYYCTPRRLRPGFEKHLGPLSIFAVYAAFGAGLALAETLTSRKSSLRRARQAAAEAGSPPARG